MASGDENPGVGDAGAGALVTDDNQATNSNRHDTQAPRIELIALDRIGDCGAQMRAEMRAETVNEYAADMLDGAVFPPVILFDDGTTLWPGDGFHRIAACRRLKRTEISAEIRKGTARDAILHAVGANAAHGLPRTNTDKRRAVETLLRDAECQQLSDRELAKLARVSHVYVGTIRRELAGNVSTPAESGTLPPSRTVETSPPSRTGMTLLATFSALSPTTR